MKVLVVDDAPEVVESVRLGLPGDLGATGAESYAGGSGSSPRGEWSTYVNPA
jgi:hypothetical protein